MKNNFQKKKKIQKPKAVKVLQNKVILIAIAAVAKKNKIKVLTRKINNSQLVHIQKNKKRKNYNFYLKNSKLLSRIYNYKIIFNN